MAKKNEGKQFEEDFKKSVPKNTYCMRFNDNALGFNQTDSTMRFTTQSPYDYFMFKSPYFFALELKSTKGKSVSFDGSSPMIKRHQIEELEKASQFENVIAGFILNFRSCQNKTLFVPIQDFILLMNKNGKKSANWLEFDHSNSIEISSKLKKVHYGYDVEKFMEDSIDFVLNKSNEENE